MLLWHCLNFVTPAPIWYLFGLVANLKKQNLFSNPYFAEHKHIFLFLTSFFWHCVLIGFDLPEQLSSDWHIRPTSVFSVDMDLLKAVSGFHSKQKEDLRVFKLTDNSLSSCVTLKHTPCHFSIQFCVPIFLSLLFFILPAKLWLGCFLSRWKLQNYWKESEMWKMQNSEFRLHFLLSLNFIWTQTEIYRFLENMFLLNNSKRQLEKVLSDCNLTKATSASFVYFKVFKTQYTDVSETENQKNKKAWTMTMPWFGSAVETTVFYSWPNSHGLKGYSYHVCVRLFQFKPQLMSCILHGAINTVSDSGQRGHLSLLPDWKAFWG